MWSQTQPTYVLSSSFIYEITQSTIQEYLSLQLQIAMIWYHRNAANAPPHLHHTAPFLKYIFNVLRIEKGIHGYLDFPFRIHILHTRGAYTRLEEVHSVITEYFLCEASVRLVLLCGLDIGATSGYTAEFTHLHPGMDGAEGGRPGLGLYARFVMLYIVIITDKV